MRRSPLHALVIASLLVPAAASADEKPADKPAEKKPAEKKPEPAKPDEKKPETAADRLPSAALPAKFGGAAKAEVPVAPTPPAELASLAFVTGTFQCEGVNPKAGDTPEHKYKSKLVSKPALDKFFAGYRYEQLKAKDHPLPIVQEGFIGYDAGLRRYLFSGADNRGMMFLLRGDPPEADRLVFKGTGTASFGSGKHVPITWIFSKTATGFQAIFEGADPDGQVVKERIEDCTRKGK